MKGYIYKIKSPNTDKEYIGSTTGCYKSRFVVHKCYSKKSYPSNKNRTYTSGEIFKYGDAYIELIEEVEVNTKNELRYIEQTHLNEKCVNRYNAYIKDSLFKK